MAGIYDNKLYAIQGAFCSDPDASTNPCSDPTDDTYTLDLSNVQLSTTNDKQIIFSPTSPVWQLESVGGVAVNSATDNGFSTSSTTYIDRFAYGVYIANTVGQANEDIVIIRQILLIDHMIILITMI